MYLTSRTRRLVLPSAFAVGIAIAVAGPAQAAPALGDQVSVLAAKGADGRSALRASLAGLRGTVTLGHVLSGQVSAGTLRVPATIELTGDTTIVARDLVLTGRTLRVVSHGHALRLYPGNTLRTEGSTITIDSSGNGGTTGATGWQGQNGFRGWDGRAGRDADLYWCDGENGSDAGDGQTADNGGDGVAGTDGADAGPISLDIPDGSTGSYLLIARGGAGGYGGNGGNGGDGGSGGEGGRGGDGDPSCYFGGVGRGGNGGHAGNGGNGGAGGNGAAGGRGGSGGAITVTYPAGYDPNLISVDLSPGPGGAGGAGGFGGTPGYAGNPGSGGFSYGDQPGRPGGSGTNGDGGPYGVVGEQGASGNPGSYNPTER